jgi:hypothetical protein
MPFPVGTTAAGGGAGAVGGGAGAVVGAAAVVGATALAVSSVDGGGFVGTAVPGVAPDEGCAFAARAACRIAFVERGDGALAAITNAIASTRATSAKAR